MATTTTTSYETLMTAVMGPDECIRGGSEAGVFESRKKVFSTPGLFMMYSMLEKSPVQRDRLMAAGPMLTSEEREQMFYRMDEAQALYTARDAIQKAYDALFKQRPDLLKALKETGSQTIMYRGGFRPFFLDLSDENGYGYNLVGRTLQGIRMAGKVSAFRGFTGFEDELTIGLVVLTIRICWEKLVTGSDNLVGLLGKSAFEILHLYGTQYSEATLKCMTSSFRAKTLSFSSGRIGPTQLEDLVELEFAYPGNLAGFLRKHGVHLYMDAIRDRVYRTLWLELGDRVMAKQHPEVDVSERRKSILASTDPSVLHTAGPNLVRAFTNGKLILPDPERSQEISTFIEIMWDNRIIQDAVFFVPRFYPLQNVSSSFYTVFDFFDVDDEIDRLSPSFPNHLVLDHGLRFTNILQYVFFKMVASYYPQDSSSLHKLYEEMIKDNASNLSTTDLMQTFFEEKIHERKRTLLLQGAQLRLECNPILVQPVTFFGLTNQLNVTDLLDHTVSDAEAVVLHLCDQREKIFPDLDVLFTTFHKACHANISFNAEDTQILFRTWMVVYQKLLTWCRILQKIYPRFSSSTTSINMVDLFFETFYPEFVLFRKKIAPIVKTFATFPGEFFAVDISFHSQEITSTLATFLLHHTEHSSRPLMTRLQDQWSVYMDAHLKALCVYKQWSHTSSLDVPPLLACPSPNVILGGESVNTNAPIPHQEDLNSTATRMAKMLRVLWDAFRKSETQEWDDRLLLLVAWMIAGRPVNDRLLSIKRYIIEKKSLKIRKPTKFHNPETGEDTVVLVPTTVVKKKKIEVDLSPCHRVPAALLQQHFGFLFQEPFPHGLDRSKIEGTLIRISYLLPDMITVQRMDPKAALLFSSSRSSEQAENIELGGEEDDTRRRTPAVVGAGAGDRRVPEPTERRNRRILPQHESRARGNVAATQEEEGGGGDYLHAMLQDVEVDMNFESED